MRRLICPSPLCSSAVLVTSSLRLTKTLNTQRDAALRNVVASPDIVLFGERVLDALGVDSPARTRRGKRRPVCR